MRRLNKKDDRLLQQNISSSTARSGRLFTKDQRPTDIRTRQVSHNHSFQVREDTRTETELKETIIIPSFPVFTGDHLVLDGTIDTDRDLVYGELKVFDSAGAIDHFAIMEVKRDGSWQIRIRRVWLEGRQYPVSVDPTLTVASNDIHLFRNTGGGCFAPGTFIHMLNGRDEKIEDIQLGDLTTGGKVVGVIQAEGMSVYNYKGVIVTGDHPVKHNDTWQLVEDVPDIKKHNSIPHCVYTIETESKRVYLPAVGQENKHVKEPLEFSAYDGIRDGVWSTFERSVVNMLNEEDGDGNSH